MKADVAMRVLSALGLCKKAGRSAAGTDAVCQALREGNLFLVAVPSDNAENTKKKIQDKCKTYGTELLSLPVTGEELAHAVGRTGHLSAFGVADENFARLIRKTVQGD